MSQKLVIGIDGLNTNSNTEVLPDGALVNISNINLDRKLATGRRGFSRHSTKSGIVKLTEYQDKLIAHTSSDVLSYYNSGWNDYTGTFTAPLTTQRMNFAGANQNLYFTTSTGIKMIDSYSATPSNAGMPKGLDLSYTLTGSSGFLTDSTQVAYRVVWGTRDANNNLYLGAPSQRNFVSNSAGGTRNVILTITIPSGITTSDFMQVYRSRISSGLTISPDDEMQLVYEANPTAGEITAKAITFTENCSELLKGAYLYSNANQEGASETNDIPPYAVDIANFKNFTFFGGIKTKHYINVNLLATSGTGLVANDTITIDGMVFVAKASPSTGLEFQLTTSGDAASNVATTALALVAKINGYASNTSVYAYYESDFNDLPGKIRIEERTFSSSAFTVSVSRAVAWTLENSGTSQNSDYPNGLMWSKIQQPEHVPYSHLELIGLKSAHILRILPLKDALFILKEDGIFRLTGVNGNWSVEVLDSSTVLISPNSAVVLNNQIYCLTNQGVVTVSDNGVQVIGEDIKDVIQELIGTDYSAIKTVSYGTAYETDRKYFLHLSSVAGDTHTSNSFVYNVFTGKWSKWIKDSVTSFVAPSVDKLYWANDSYLLEERKSFTRTDFVDEQLVGPYNVVSYSGTTVTLNSTLGVTTGDVLYESSSVYAIISSVDDSTNSVVVDSSQTWTIATITILSGIDCYIEWAPQFCDNSGLEKAFESVITMFKQASFSTATMDFYTDLNGGWQQITITSTGASSEWGLFAWGEVPWGGLARPRPVRVSVPRNKSRGQLLGIRFSCRSAYAMFSIEGLSLQFDSVSERLGERT